METTGTCFYYLNSIQSEKNGKKIPIKLINIVWSIKVIVLSGMQFGLKWCAWFQNECTERVCFEVTSMIWDQNCTKWSSVYHFTASILNCKIQLLKYRIFKSELIFYWSSIGLVLIYKKSSLSFSCNVIGSFKQVLKSDWLLCFSKAVYLAGKKGVIKSKKCNSLSFTCD